MMLTIMMMAMMVMVITMTVVVVASFDSQSLQGGWQYVCCTEQVSHAVMASQPLLRK